MGARRFVLYASGSSFVISLANGVHSPLGVGPMRVAPDGRRFASPGYKTVRFTKGGFDTVHALHAMTDASTLCRTPFTSKEFSCPFSSR